MEKFALLNLLKALDGLTPKNDGGEKTQKDGTEKAPPPSTAEEVQSFKYPNVMAGVLERHEIIANRIKNNHR